jgi:hypothetical protein
MGFLAMVLSMPVKLAVSARFCASPWRSPEDFWQLMDSRFFECLSFYGEGIGLQNLGEPEALSEHLIDGFGVLLQRGRGLDGIVMLSQN